MSAKPSIAERISALLRRAPSDMAGQGAGMSSREPGDEAFDFHYRQTKAEGGMLDPTFAAELAKVFGLETFIETGTYRGDTLWPLMDEFKALISIELDDDLYAAAVERFKDVPQIVLLKGNSAEMLTEGLAMTSPAPALIWLDAHFSGVGTAFGGTNTPVYDELDAIFASKRTDDVILIDDLRCFRQLAEGFLKHASLEAYPSADDVAARLRANGFVVFVLCDSLIAIPASRMAIVKTSSVLEACTRLRLERLSDGARRDLEEVVRGATGPEKDALVALPAFVIGSAPYGLGGDYFYWRSLVLDLEEPDQAREDRDFARRCGVTP